MFHRTRAARLRSGSLFFALIIIIGVLPGRSRMFAQEADADSVLRQRIHAFWNAMQKQDYATATQFVHPDSREAFQYRIPKSRVNSFRLDKLTCNAQRSACDAVVLVKKPVAIINAREVEWPLHSHWVLEQGNWYFQVKAADGRNPMLDIFRAQNEAEEKMAQTRPEPEAHKHPSPPPAVSQIRIFSPDPSNPRRVHRGEKAVFRFNFTNRTSEPVRIVSVHSDCHCTSVASSYPEVGPGKTGVVEATLDTFGLPLGPVTKEIQVVFADLADPVGVRLTTTNEPNFEVTPPQIEFGAVPSGRAAEQTLRIVNRSGQSVRLLQLNSSPKLAAIPAEAVLAPGEELDIKVRYSSGTEGEFAESLMLKTDLAAEPLITVIAHGKITR